MKSIRNGLPVLMIALAVFSPATQAQTWSHAHARTLILPGSGTDVANTLTLQLAASTAGGLTWTLPSSNGSSGQVLSTNGSGTLSWLTAVAASADNSFTGANTFAPSNASAVALTIKGSSTSGDIFDIKNNAGTTTWLSVNHAGLTTVTGGLTATGATTINNSGTANTDIGNGSGTLSLTSNHFTVSTAGAVSGATTYSGSGDITTTAGQLVSGSNSNAGHVKIGNGAASNFFADVVTQSSNLTADRTYTLPSSPDRNVTIGLSGASVCTTNTGAITGNNSTATASMEGLAVAITPVTTGKVFIMVTGNLNQQTNAAGGTVQIRTGTGTAPSNGGNGGGTTGTAQGAAVTYVAASVNQPMKIPFALNAIQTGMTLGTAYWIDLSLIPVTGGTASIASITVSAFELP